MSFVVPFVAPDDAGLAAYAAAMMATTPTPAVTVNVDFSVHPGPIVPATAYGVHTSIYDGNLVKNASVWGGKLAAIGVKNLRYPGGNYADQYHFSNNTMTPGQTSDPNACSKAPGPYFDPGDNFGAWLTTAAKAPGADSNTIITVNYGSNVDNNGAWSLANGQRCSNPAMTSPQGSAEGAAAQVAYANTVVGAPDVTLGNDGAYNWGTAQQWANLRTGVGGCNATGLANVDFADLCTKQAAYGAKYWEVGNEIYGNGYYGPHWQEDLNAPYSSTVTRKGDAALGPGSYGTRAYYFIQKMRAVDASIKIGTVVDHGDFATKSLGALCAKDSTNLDFVSFHYYPVNGTATPQWPAQALVHPHQDIPGIVSDLTSILATANCKTPSGYNPAIFVTEMNALSGAMLPDGKVDATTDVGWQNITTEGQFAADAYLTFLDHHVQNIDWVELHNNEFLSGDGNETKRGVYYGIQMANQIAPTSATLFPCTTSDATNVVCHASILPDGNHYGILISNIGTGPISSTTQPTGYTVDVTINLSGASFSTTNITKYTYSNFGKGISNIVTEFGAAIGGTTFTVTIDPLSMVEYIIPKA